jgi:hypothetical protein
MTTEYFVQFTAKSYSAQTRKQNENELAPHNALTPSMPREISSNLEPLYIPHKFLVFHISLAENCNNKVT